MILPLSVDIIAGVAFDALATLVVYVYGFSLGLGAEQWIQWILLKL